MDDSSRNEMESYAKRLLYERYGIDVRDMAPGAIASVREVIPRLSKMLDFDRNMVDLLLQLAETNDKILREVAEP